MIMKIKRSNPPVFYDFANWGYYTNDLMHEAMPGFVATPPSAEICGVYDILFVAALRYNTGTCNADMLLRRTVREGTLTLSQTSSPFDVVQRVKPLPQGGIPRRREFRSQTTFSGRVEYKECHRYFGPGYNFFGLTDDSQVSQNYEFKPSNSATIVTKRNNNLGRLYVVSKRKAFQLIKNEVCSMKDAEFPFESQEHETKEAERICRSHHSFLCQQLGLPCQVASHISQYAIHDPPYIFAEPGDVWIDIRLSTPVRTYVLARRRQGIREQTNTC